MTLAALGSYPGKAEAAALCCFAGAARGAEPPGETTWLRLGHFALQQRDERAQLSEGHWHVSGSFGRVAPLSPLPSCAAGRLQLPPAKATLSQSTAFPSLLVPGVRPCMATPAPSASHRGSTSETHGKFPSTGWENFQAQLFSRALLSFQLPEQKDFAFC